MREKTELYRHFDTDGRLLYVGVSLSTVARLSSHMCESKWSGQIASITIERFPTRQEALAAEAAAIKLERPAHNVAQGEKPVVLWTPAVNFPREYDYRWDQAQKAARAACDSDPDYWERHGRVVRKWLLRKIARTDALNAKLAEEYKMVSA